MSPVNKVAIVGSGIVGRCWAVIFARAKCEVTLYDIDDNTLNTAKDSIKEKLEDLKVNDMLFGETIESISERISTTTDKNKLREADYIQECTPEVLEIKKKVFKMLDECANDTAILASSTSCIMPSLFSEDLKKRNNVLVAHPMNPPHFIPCVEVIPSKWTGEDVIVKTRAFLDSTGQKTVRLNKEVDGFIVNRLQYALLNEAYSLVNEGLCSPEDVDTAVADGLALRWSFMGPFETIDLNAPNGTDDYFERFSEGIYRVCQTQQPVEMKGETVKKINSVMRQRAPIGDLKKKMKWRDNRLAALANHKSKAAKDYCSQ